MNRQSPDGASGAIDFVALPVVFWLVGALLLGDGRTPLGDSWTYSWAAAQLIDHGRIALHDAQAMTLVGQLFLAWPAGRLFSSAPSTLNHFTLIIASITLGLFLAIYRNLGLGRGLSLLGVATLASNPLWLAQSLAFESEMFFLFFAAIGVVAFQSWATSQRDADLWFAGLAFAAAAMVRQTAVVFVAAGLLVALRGRLHIRYWLPWFLPLLFLAGFYLIVHALHRVPSAYEWQQEMIRLRWSDPKNLLWTASVSVVAATMYLGFFVLPISAAIVSWPRRAASAAVVIVMGATLGTAVVALHVSDAKAMPYLPNLIQPEFVFEILKDPETERAFRMLWTGVSWIGAALLAAVLAAKTEPGGDDRSSATGSIVLFLAASVILFLCFNLAIGFAFDRYLLLPLPFLIPLLLVRQRPSRRRVQGGFVLAGLGLAVTILMTDHRVRLSTCLWDAAEELRSTGIEAPRINGGVPFNGYYAYGLPPRVTRRDRWAALLPLFQPDAEFLVIGHPHEREGVTLQSSRHCAALPIYRSIDAYTYRCAPRTPGEAMTLCQPL